MKRIWFDTKKEALEYILKKKSLKFYFRAYYDAFEKKYYIVKFKKKSFWDFGK